MFSFKMHYVQFSIQRRISNADEQKHISQMPAIDVYVQLKQVKLK